jgi:CubicO group peptidase (beta-lactamase class C family)
MRRTHLIFDISIPTLIALAMAAAAAIVGFASGAEQPSIRRLDGSTIAPAEVDATVTRLMKAAEVPGVAIAIFNDGKIAYERSYGFRDTEKKLPLTEDSVMTAASFSKVAAGYMEMQLVQEGILDLDKPVYQYLPKPLTEYPDYTDLAGDPRYKKITARMLLSHTSGFPNLRWFNEDRKLNINFEPGSRFAYSGEGINLLQFVAETITKKPFEDLMREHVFQPIGMTRTSMVWQSRFESDFANGYDEYGRSLGPERRKTANAAGSMQTTPRDFARFMLAVMHGEGLHKEIREQMLSPQIRITSKHEFPSLENEATDANDAIRLSYGLGWGLYWTPSGEAFFKEGHDEGWRNYTVCFDKQKSGMLIMTNSSNGEGIFKDLLETLLRDTFTPIEWERYAPYNELPPRVPLKEHKIVSVSPDLLEKYTGRYGTHPNIVLVVRREGDHLSVQENDEPKQDLFPESEREFFSKTADDEFTFELDAQGRVTSMTLHTDGKDISIKRLE